MSEAKTAGEAAYRVWRTDTWPPWDEVPVHLRTRFERAAAEAIAFGEELRAQIVAEVLPRPRAPPR